MGDNFGTDHTNREQSQAIIRSKATLSYDSELNGQVKIDSKWIHIKFQKEK